MSNLVDTFDLEVINPDGERKTVEIFMSYTQLSDITRIIGTVQAVGGFDMDPDLADAILWSLLAPRDRRGRPTKYDPDAEEGFVIPDMSQAEADRLFLWVKEHALGFFLGRLEKTIDLLQQNKGRMEAVGQSLNGTPLVP